MKRLHRLIYPPAWSIAAKISAALLSVALIPMGIATYHNLQQSLSSVAAGEYRKLELLATSKASQLDQLIIDIQRVAVQLSNDRDIVSFLAATPTAYNNFLPATQKTIDNVFRSNPDYDAVFVLNKQGRCIAATDPTFIGRNYAFREYFKQAVQGRSFVSSVLVGETSGRAGLFFSNPVRNDRGEILGATILKIRGEDIWAIVDALQNGGSSYGFLIDREGVIISHPNRSLLYHSLVPLSPETLQKILSDRHYGSDRIHTLNLSQLAAAMIGARETGHTSYYSPADQSDQIVGFAPLQEQDWVLGVSKPKTQFAAPLNHLMWQNSTIVLVVGAIAIFIALLLARSIARPIRILTAAAQALERDDFEPQVLELHQQLVQVSRTPDDIGQLVRVFMHMAEEVRMRDQKLKLQVLELRIEVDETKRASQLAEITETDYFQQLQRKVRTFRDRTAIASETETDYLQQLQKKVQKLKCNS